MGSDMSPTPISEEALGHAVGSVIRTLDASRRRCDVRRGLMPQISQHRLAYLQKGFCK